ncbi:amidohydrolase family protein [Acidobacteria bacterium AH-259-D05]|nr:amidohydrolase family protein [Acidobacteria bacterium AH-259-D05]
MFKKTLRFGILAVSIGGMCGVSQAQQASLPPEVMAFADLVLHNGKIITADDNEAVFSAVAIRDGKFLALGNDDRILSMGNPDTRKIDLEGKSVVPGFIDTHLHQAFVGNISKLGDSGRVTLKDKQSGLEEVRRLIEATPAGQWVTLRAPRARVFYDLTRKDIDPLSPNNPVYFVTQGAEVLANTLALNLANIPPDTPGMVKDPQTGEPTGQLVLWAAGIMLYEAQPWPPLRNFIEPQKKLFSKMNAEGLTTIIARAQGLSISVFRELWRKQELTARVRVAHEFLRLNPNGEAYLKRLGNLSGFGDEWFKIIGTTVMPVDGADGDGASLTATPRLRVNDNGAFGHLGHNRWIGYGNREESPNEWDSVPQEVKEKTEYQNIILANRYGWNITSVHSAGDEATRVTLKAYEDASREKPLDGRWGIDHQPLQTPETIALIKKLNVIPSFYYFTPGGGGLDGMVYQYGADRVSQMVPLNTFIKEGILPVAEADTSRYPFYAPMYNLEAFVTRKNPQADDGRVYGPAEKITRMQALYMYTKWAARYTDEEQLLGTIEPGKLADLVVLDGDFFSVPEDEMFEKLPVVMTIVGGKIVYQTTDKTPSNKPEARR